MKLLHHTLLCCIVLLCFPFYCIKAQVSAGGHPVSQLNKQRGFTISEAESTLLPALPIKKIHQEDEQNPGNTRFAAPTSVDYTLDNSGTWEQLPEGGRLWRLKIQSGSALGLAVFYKDFYLPPGAQLYMYDPSYQQVLGAYTAQNNKASGLFFTGFISGGEAIIEYYEPATQLGQGRFSIFRVDQVYHKENFDASRNPLMFGFGTSQACHKNANCTEGDAWPDQKRSACRIVMVLEEGTGYCSGTLVNNTSEDETPYILSAYHCQDGYTPIYDMWRFEFEYQSTGCTNPALEPSPNSIIGSTLRAGRLESDFLLLEITTAIPATYDLYYAGWDKGDGVPQSGVNFHHPSGDIKKVSLYDQPAVIHPFAINWNNNVTTPVNHHFRLNYSEGSFEVGSSGSALFNENGQVVGQLNGGVNGACAGTPTLYFGRLALSWDGGGTADTRLKDWLDPMNLGADTIGGMAQPAAGEVSIQGVIQNESGSPVENVQLDFSGPIQETVFTDENGAYLVENVPIGQPVGIALSRADNAQNGCSTFDLIRISQHILGVDALDSPYKLFAADANGSAALSPLDQIAIRKVILGLETSFPGRPLWQFFPVNYPFSNPDDPLSSNVPDVFFITNFTQNITVDFIGIKTGDIDDSADTLLD